MGSVGRMTEKATPGRPASLAISVARIARFTAVMYKPHYLLYGVLWVAALEGTAALVSHPQAAWRPGPGTVARIVVVAFVLLYLRMVDEQKDLEYDRVHNPDRPLVTGAVDAVELRVAMGVIALGAVAASLALSIGSAIAIAAALGYGLALWGLERIAAPVRERLLLNLAVTYPVQLLITGYVLVSAIGTGQVAARVPVAAVAVIFAGAFLQFEFARKTSVVARPGEWFYSNVLGANGSTAASLACAAVAIAVDLILVRPWRYSDPAALIAWIPLALLIFPISGAARFRRAGADHEYPVLPAVLFILTMYVTCLAQSLVLP
jgi:hypothetical protein